MVVWITLHVIENTSLVTGIFYGAPVHKHLKLLDFICEGRLDPQKLDVVTKLLNERAELIDDVEIIY